MIDLHAHVLPHLDDGPKNMAQTEANLRQAVASGTHTIVTVAHANDHHYDVQVDAYWNAYDSVQEWLSSTSIAITLIPAMEVRLSPDIAEGYQSQKFLPIGDSGFICVELPSVDFPSYTLNALYELALAEIHPILIHPERNRGLRKMPELADRLMDMGIVGVASMGSLTGQFGEDVQKSVWSFIDNGLIQAVATDGHSVEKRPLTLSVAYEQLKNRYGSDVAKEMTLTTPAKILEGNLVSPVPHKPTARTLLQRIGFKRP